MVSPYYEDSGVQFARNVPNYPNYNHWSIQHPQLQVATIQADGLCLSWTTKESTCLSRSISPCSWASCWLVPPTKMKRKANKINLKRLVWQLIWFILLHTSQVIETNSLAHPLVSSGSRSPNCHLLDTMSLCANHCGNWRLVCCGYPIFLEK